MKKIFLVFMVFLFCAWTHGVPNNYFVQDGSSYPWDNPYTTPPGLYAASTNTTWLFWEGWESIAGTNQRVVEVATKNHSIGKWVGNYLVGTKTLVDDLHGIPSAVRDPSTGFVYCFYGAHNSALQIAWTSNADDPSSWQSMSLSENIYGPITFPKGFIVGSTLYLFYSTKGVGTDDQEAIAVTTATLSNGVPTWSGTKTVLFDSDSGGTGWLLVGTMLLNGTKVSMCFNYGTVTGNNPVMNGYYASYDTATGSVANFTGDAIITSAEQPVTLTTINADFLIYTSDYTDGITMAVDGAGTTHIILGDSSSGVSLLNHISNSGSGWSAPHTVYTYSSIIENAQAGMVSNGTGVDVYYSDATFGNSSQYTQVSGNIWKVNYNDVSWGSATEILTAMTYGIENSTAITNANSNARIMFTEVSNDGVTIAGNLRGWVYGDAGFVARGTSILQPAPTPILDSNFAASNIVLSGASLVATAGSNATTSGIVRGLTWHTTGKYYFEVTMNDVVANVAMGIINGNQSISASLNPGLYAYAMYRQDGALLGGISGTLASYSTNAVIGVTVDLINDKMWFYNGTNWNNDILANQNPATNTGGLAIDNRTLSAPLYPAILLTSTNGKATINFGASLYSYSAPTGFGNW